ncbi:tripartite tricarboxylate transporter substrate binding protein [Rhodoplanes sp.]|uniref:tripartite tricarboxylate transporter substrate binding protein n=1 Tax=Rhodoplanes sp. TaxID=1968906 RepID=UPI0025F3AE47|nr:tripartite tricarboxylate transporter substrate binding protein [Rhodoplanes sp.]
MAKLKWFATVMLVFGLTTSAQAQYPAKPIEMIVAYSAGGVTDLTARIVASFMEKYIGGRTKIVVVNRPGAAGEIGFTALAEAKPDGYTIGFINTPTILSIPIERATKFTWKSYDLLGNLVDDPSGFSVHKDSQFRTLKELQAYAKANPGTVTVGTTGVGSDDHLAMLAFQRAAGVKMTHVPYAGGSMVRTAVLGRHIAVASINIGEAMQYVASGSPFVQLAQAGAMRSSVAPDVPTFKELGFDMESNAMRGVAAPKGLPPEVRKILEDAVTKTAADPEFQAKMAATFSPMRYLPPAEYAVALERAEQLLQKLWSEEPWSPK